MSEDWQAAVEHLYAVFACYRRPSHLDASPTRDPDAILRELSSVPLRELPAASLGSYAGHAMTTVGGEGDYRHFLPRIIELSITRNGWMGLDPEQIACTLKYGHWRTWAEDAQAAILCAFGAAWVKTRAEMTDAFNSIDVLCGLAILGEDIAPLLAAWTAPSSPAEVLQMAEHVRVAADLDTQVYWKQAGGQNRRALWNWARSAVVRNELEEGAIAFTADADFWEIDRALLDISASAAPN